MLELRDLAKSYGTVTALDGCSFDVERGQLVGFLGPNGAGKTTAMRAVFGLVRPDRGEVRWEGRPIGSAERLRFGYMPEQRGLYPRMKIFEQLVYFGRLHGLDRETSRTEASSWLERLGLEERGTSRLEELSHGNQQRVQLAAALIHRPELLVLDEPFSGLDPVGVNDMASILAGRAADGVAVVFSSHQLDLVEDLCEDVVVIHNGAIVLDGPVAELRARSPRRYLTVEVDGSDTGWAEMLEGAEVMSQVDGKVVLAVGKDIDLAAVIEKARASGNVTQFVFEPPNLSEVFLEAVGR